MGRNALPSIALALLLAASSAVPAAAESIGFVYSGGTYTTLAVPGAVYTQANSINNPGQVAGFYYGGGVEAGFIYSGGTYTTLSVTGAEATVAFGINDSGQVVGNYIPGSGGRFEGFLYSGGTYTILNVPGATSTAAYGINNVGQIVGFYFDPATGQDQAFLYSGGSYTTLPVEQAFGISNTGEIVGTSGGEGFVDNAGAYTYSNFPGGSYTSFNGINAGGQIVGSDCDVGNQGFVYSGGMYTILNFPPPPGENTDRTCAFGINDYGAVVGFADTQPQTVSEPSTLSLLTLALLGSGLLLRRLRNAPEYWGDVS